MLPKYAAENFPQIRALVQGLMHIAKNHDSTPAQIALAWILAQGSDIIPIPGTKSIQRLEENARSVEICLTDRELEEIRVLVQAGVPGTRYPAG